MSLTPAQLNVIRTWTEQRDALTTEVGQLTTERDILAQSNREGAEALSDLTNRIAEVRGRIAELDALEELRRTSVAADVAALEALKSSLEADIVAKQGWSKIWDDRIAEKTESFNLISSVLVNMGAQANIVDEVVGQVIEVSKNAVTDMKEDMSEVRTVVLEVIEKSRSNIDQTNIVIEGLPKFIFDMQKPIPVRRTYPVGHPNYEDPHSVSELPE